MRTNTRGSLCSLILSVAVVGGCNCKGKSSTIQKSDGVLAALPTSLNFGNVPVNQRETLKLTVTNTGVGEVTLDSPNGQAITGDTSNSFSAQTFKTGFPIGGSNVGTVTFAPTVGGLLTAKLVFSSDASDTPFAVDLTGTGIDINVSCTPTSVNFGPVQVGASPSPTQTVTCTNNGASSALLSVSGVNTDSQFTLTDTNGLISSSNQQTLAAGASYDVTVTFAPTAVGNVTSSFTYTACATAALCAQPASIALNGVGVSGSLAIVPSPITYSNVPTGSTLDQTITVTNVGTNSLSVSCLSLDSVSGGNATTGCGQASASGTFTFSALPTLPAMLTAGQSFTFTLTYKASGGTMDGDTLDAFYTSAGAAMTSETQDQILGNQQVNPCTLTISPSTISFGTVTLGTTLTKSATLTNTGESTCNISGVALDSSSDPSFALDSSTSAAFPIPAGGSATITVDFNLNNSSTPNQRKGLVDYTSNDPNHATGTIPLIAYLQTNSPYANGWPKWHYDNNNSGHTSADTSNNTGAIVWKVSGVLKAAGSSIEGTLSYINSPVVGDNTDGTYTIYQVSMNGSLYAFNQAGTTLWSTALSDPTGDPHPDTPIVTKSGNIYAVSGCDSENQSSPKNLFYLNTSGTILSSQPYGEDGFDACPGLGTDTAGNTIFFEADDDGSVMNNSSTDPYSALSFQASSTGSVSVTAGLALPLTSESERFGIGIADDASSFWGNNGQFFAITPPLSGFALLAGWPAGGVTQPGTNSQVNNGNEVYSDLAVDSTVTNSIFAYSAWEEQNFNFSGITYQVGGVIQSLDLATGAQKWMVSLPTNSISPSGLLSDFGNAAPAYDISTNQVYVGNSDGLRAIDMSSGTVNWQFKTANVTSSPAIGGDGSVFFGCADGSFYALQSNGTLRYKVVAAKSISASPAIADDGIVYFVSDDGILWAVQ